MNAEQRSAKFMAELDEVDQMMPDQLRIELRKLALGAPSVIQAASVAALASDMARLGQRNSDRHFTGASKRWCSHCPFPEGCVACDL
jgi:hypothetical protein